MEKIIIRVSTKIDPPMLEVPMTNRQEAKDRILYSMHEYSGFWSDQDNIFIPVAAISKIEIISIEVEENQTKS